MKLHDKLNWLYLYFSRFMTTKLGKVGACCQRLHPLTPHDLTLVMSHIDEIISQLPQDLLNLVGC